MTKKKGSHNNHQEYFNPHEREARDFEEVSRRPFICDFNPHEREARDAHGEPTSDAARILIHTSVKLVTSLSHLSARLGLF